jgi:starch synthase
MTPRSPNAGTPIARAYGSDTLEHKVQNKTAMQEKLGWPEEPKRAVICIPAGVSDKLGGSLLKELLPGLLELPVEILILGKGSASYGSILTELSKEQSHRIAIIPNDDKSIDGMYAAADIALFLSDATTMPELAAALRFGTVPVAPSTKVIGDYNPNQESGEGFLYAKPSVWHCYAAVVRALETYKFPFDWRTIQKHDMEKVK